MKVNRVDGISKYILYKELREQLEEKRSNEKGNFEYLPFDEILKRIQNNKFQ